MEKEQIIVKKQKTGKKASHFWYLTFKNLKSMFRDKAELAWIFGIPVFLVVLLFLLYGESAQDAIIVVDGIHLSVFDLMAPGVVISGTVVILGQIASHFNEERDKKTLLRLATTPVARSNIIFSGMLSQIAVAAVQTTFSLLLIFCFGAYIHPNANWMLLFCIPLLYAFTSLGMGVIVASFLKSRRGLFGITFIIILFLIFLGGCLSYGAEIVVSDYIPTTYAVDAMRSVMTFGDSSWNAIGEDIIVLIVSGIVFPIIGVLLFKRNTALN